MPVLPLNSSSLNDTYTVSLFTSAYRLRQSIRYAEQDLQMWYPEVSANAVNTPIPSNSHQIIPSPAPDHFKRLSFPVPTRSENLFPFAQPFPPVAIRTRFKQVIARRDDMPAPIAADLRPCADGSAVRTALVAWPRRCAPSWPRWDRQTDGRITHRLMPPPCGWA